jgi:hypothetical protein
VLGAVSGATTVVAAAGDVFGLRNVSSRAVAISGIRLRWVTSTAFGAAQSLAFRVNKVYGFNAIHTTGGTAVQAHYKRQANIRGSSVGDRVPLTDLSAYICNTGAITGATYTAEDTDEPEMLAVGAGSVLPGVYEDWFPADGLPLVLEQNQGIVVNNHITMGATGVGNLFVGVELFREYAQ